jgi:hypothetical protein
MNSKRIATFLSLVGMLALVLSIPTMAVADDDDDYSRFWDIRCKLQGLEGTWIYSFELPYGAGSAKALVTINSTGYNKGTIDWEFIAPSSHPADCPDCYWSSARGVWKKTGRKTYEFTTQGFYVVDGATTFTILNEGTIALTGCNTAEFNLEFTIFFYGTDEIYLQGVYDPGEMQRLLLHQPLPIQ